MGYVYKGAKKIETHPDNEIIETPPAKKKSSGPKNAAREIRLARRKKKLEFAEFRNRDEKQWTEVPECDRYLVSIDGDIIDPERFNILKPFKSKNKLYGISVFLITNDDYRREVPVNHITSKVFNPNHVDGRVIVPLDGDDTNFRADNLLVTNIRLTRVLY